MPTVRPHGNPVNIRADATGERYTDVLRVLIAAQEVDTILVLHTPTAMVSGMAAAEAVVRVVSETGGNILICWIGGETALPRTTCSPEPASRAMDYRASRYAPSCTGCATVKTRSC